MKCAVRVDETHLWIHGSCRQVQVAIVRFGVDDMGPRHRMVAGCCSARQWPGFSPRCEISSGHRRRPKKRSVPDEFNFYFAIFRNPLTLVYQSGK